MPHVSSSGGGDDLGSEDEVKVFKDEGEEEKRSSENLTEDKSDLIDLTESEVRRNFVVTRLHFSPPCSRPPSPLRCVSVVSRFSYPPYFPVRYTRYPACTACTFAKVDSNERDLRVLLQEKGSLAGGSYATTGKTSARSDLSPVFGKSLFRFAL